MQSVMNGKTLVALKVTKKHVLFFDIDGVWTSMPLKEAYENGVGNVYRSGNRYIASHGITGLEKEVLERHCLSLLYVGDTFDRYLELLKTERLGVIPEGVDRFIVKFDTPKFGRIKRNAKNVGLRYVVCFMWVYEHWKDKEQFVRDNVDEIIRRTSEHLAKNKFYQRFNIPIEDLEVTKVALMSRTRLKIVYEPKEKYKYEGIKYGNITSSERPSGE